MGYEAAVNTALARLGKSKERTSDYALALISGIPEGLLRGLAARDHYKRQKAEQELAQLQYRRQVAKDASQEAYQQEQLTLSRMGARRAGTEDLVKYLGMGRVPGGADAALAAAKGQLPQAPPEYIPALSPEEAAALGEQLGAAPLSPQAMAGLAGSRGDEAVGGWMKNLSPFYGESQQNARSEAGRAQSERHWQAGYALDLRRENRLASQGEGGGGTKTLDDRTKRELENDRDYLEAGRKVTALQHQASILSTRLNQGSGQYGAGASTAEQDRAALTSTAAELERARKFSDDLYYWYLGGKYGPRPSPYSEEPFVPSTPDAYAGGGVQTKVSPDGNVIYVTGSPRR